MNTFTCPFCNAQIISNGTAYTTQCEHFQIGQPLETRIPYIVSNLKNINQNSIVYDVGGFTGIFASCMVNSFNPKMVIFEPTKKYYLQLTQKFKNATIHNYGLGAYTRTETIYVDGQNTSIHQHWTTNAQKEIINLVDVNQYINTNQPEPIDLLALNCEGGEYEILPELIKSGNIKKCKQVLIQFHNINENSLHDATLIGSALSKTHNQTLNVGIWKWLLYEIK